MKVVHLSKTPLAGSPGRFAMFQSDFGMESVHFYENDYPGDLKGKMLVRSIHFDKSELSVELLENELATADIVHVHNHITDAMVTLVNKCFSGKILACHVHSPLREGPLFNEILPRMDLEFNRRFVVAQYQPRQYQDYTPVCNIVPDSQIKNIRCLNQKLSFLYTPAHSRKGGRWNEKASSILTSTLLSAEEKSLLRLVNLKKVSEYELMQFRKICDVTIDEIATGSYHQVSLEGLSAGNIVVNAADKFSLEMLKMSVKAPIAPPFFEMNEYNCVKRVDELLDMSISTVEEMKLESRYYYEKYLRPSRLCELLLEKYHENK